MFLLAPNTDETQLPSLPKKPNTCRRPNLLLLLRREAGLGDQAPTLQLVRLVMKPEIDDGELYDEAASLLQRESRTGCKQ